MVNREEFLAFLRRSGRSAGAANRCLAAVVEFEQWLQGWDGSTVGGVSANHIVDYVAAVEATPKASAKTQLWALAYYFEFIGDHELRDLCRALRQERIDPKPFALRGFSGITPEAIDQLARIGIINADQMLAIGHTPPDRVSVAVQADLAVETITELVKLCDLARIPGIKGIRARLYYDAGVETVEALAGWDPNELQDRLVRFCADTSFEGVAPLPKEVARSVMTARSLTKVIET